MNMGLMEQLQGYYQSEGISPESFTCRHEACCKGTCSTFVQATMPFIGRSYSGGDLPRLLFVSSDPGSGEASIEHRTLEGMQRWHDSNPVSGFRPQTHWWRTHEFARLLFRSFGVDLDIEDVTQHIALVNSAKCNLNRTNHAEALPRMFTRCREFLPAEVEILAPDIMVSQGIHAHAALAYGFGVDCLGLGRECQHHPVVLKAGTAHWIHTYHPNARGGLYQRQVARAEEWAALWAKEVRIR